MQRDFPPVAEQLAKIKRGLVDLVGEEDLVKRLHASKKNGKPLRVKLGIDPSSADLHLGHTVVLRKLRAFQVLGHLPVLIWGTATARVGDPTGKDKTRPELSEEEIRENLFTYRAQISKVIDVEAMEQFENATWFDEMSFMTSVKLMARMTVARAIERDSFQKRMKAGQPVSLHEIVYPIMQGWDSVEVRSDIEIGGTDQIFNLLVGRDLQAQEGQAPQICITLPLIEGLDGTQKMSKSLGNYIGIHDAPSDMFGKIMSIPDTLMEKYFTLLSDVPEAEVNEILAGHPREAKARLGQEIVAAYHGQDAAEKARAEFDRVFRDKDKPSDIGEFAFPAEELRDGTALLSLAVFRAGLATSTTDARRLMSQGGMRLDGEQACDPKAVLRKGRYLLQAGKRKFIYLLIP